MTKQPSYRFVGYTEPWEEKKLGNLGSVEMCRRIFKEETSAEFEIPFFKIGTFGGEADTYITREKFEEYKTKFAYPQRGDLLLSASGSIGRVVEYDGDEAYYQDSNIVWLNHHGKINNKFLKAFYEIVSWSGIEGTTIKRLYNKNILETDISLPSLPEQTAIGSFFQDIDQLISLQQRKLEVLKEQKKTYLKLLFPAKGQTKPALRFVGFEDDWKEVKLGEVGVTKSGVGFPDSEQGGVRGIPFYKVSDMNNIGNEIEMVTSNNYVTQEQIDSRKWKVIDTVPAIMFAKVGAALLLNRKRLIREPFLIDNNTMVYIPSAYWEVMFCKILFDTLNLSKYSQVGALPSYNGSDIEAIQVLIPTLPEQEAIGSFFQDLDKAIAKQEEKVNQLKESKQTLLRKMFI